MPVSSSRPERVRVKAVARDLLARPSKVFLFNWNWKAGLLGGVFRALFFIAAVLPRDPAGLRGVAIQLAFRVAIGGLRRGLMLTGKGTDSLATDFRRLPAALVDLALAGPRTLMRVLRGNFA